jgi:hypothetical protein
MSEPNTSEPLHSSCAAGDLRVRVGELADVTEQVDRDAADRRRTLHRSSRVTSSEQCRRSARTGARRSPMSVVPKRSAIPGRYQTGSMATLVTETLALACTT